MKGFCKCNYIHEHNPGIINSHSFYFEEDNTYEDLQYVASREEVRYIEFRSNIYTR